MSEASNDYFYHKWQETLKENARLARLVNVLEDIANLEPYYRHNGSNRSLMVAIDMAQRALEREKGD